MTQLQTTTVIAFGLAVAFIVWGKNTQADNFFKREVRPIVRKSMAPDAFNELERKVAKINRPIGCVKTLKPLPRAKPAQLVINDMDRSSVDSIIIREVLQ